MPDTLQTSLKLGEASEITLEEAERITLGEAQGDDLGNWNGFDFKRAVAVDRSSYVVTSTAVSR